MNATLTRYVRVRRVIEGGYVELEFSVGSPDVFVEMILPLSIFDDFCERTGVEILPSGVEGSSEEEAGPWNWRLADARERGIH